MVKGTKIGAMRYKGEMEYGKIENELDRENEEELLSELPEDD